MPVLTGVLRRTTHSHINVLELGSGCGIVGIAVAQCYPNCAVQLTDQADALELIYRNVGQAIPAKNSSLQSRILDWDAVPNDARPERDLTLIVVSDCTYNADSCPGLVRTIARLSSSSPMVRILVAMKRRHDSEDIFFQLMHDANMHVLEETTIELPSQHSVAEAGKSQIEFYLYGLMEKGDSGRVGLGQ